MSPCRTCKTWTPTKDDGTCRWCGDNKYDQWAGTRAAEAERGRGRADGSLPAEPVGHKDNGPTNDQSDG